MNVIPLKRFGQHFLVDEAIIDTLIQEMQPKQEEHWVEIGPGLGALTRHLINRIQSLDVVEIDPRLVQELKKMQFPPSLTIHQQDILHFQFQKIASGPRSLHICGNLPYQISTPLLFHLFPQLECIHSLFFMLQKEVVERLAAKPCHKAYGRLSIHVQYHTEVIPLLTIPPDAFDPPPHVESMFVKLMPRRSHQNPIQNPKLFDSIVTSAFMARRKMLKNALSEWLKDEDFKRLHIHPERRPDQLTVEEYIRISNMLNR